jgi:hypothetical protein
MNFKHHGYKWNKQRSAEHYKVMYCHECLRNTYHFKSGLGKQLFCNVCLSIRFEDEPDE